RWIMAGGHVDPAKRLPVPNRETDDRRRRVSLAKQRRELVVDEHLGRRQRELPSQETSIVAKNDVRLASGNRLRVIQFSAQVKGDCLSGEADIFKREIASNQAAPAR